MCREVKCGTCGKPSWSGCGAHVEQVLGHVPRDLRCKCREKAPEASGTGPKPARPLFGLF